MSKEIVAGIGKAIEEAQRAKEREAAKKRAAELMGEEEQRALIARNEARLRATGVVDLFEELRDSGVLKLSEKPAVKRQQRRGFWDWRVVGTAYYEPEPARIHWDSDRKKISISFDNHKCSVSDADGYKCDVVLSNFLEAEITESGVLRIGKHEVETREELKNVVRDEILRIKGLKE